jgi:hypothetical protein
VPVEKVGIQFRPQPLAEAEVVENTEKPRMSPLLRVLRLISESPQETLGAEWRVRGSKITAVRLSLKAKTVAMLLGEQRVLVERVELGQRATQEEQAELPLTIVIRLELVPAVEVRLDQLVSVKTVQMA